MARILLAFTLMFVAHAKTDAAEHMNQETAADHQKQESNADLTKQEVAAAKEAVAQGALKIMQAAGTSAQAQAMKAAMEASLQKYVGAEHDKADADRKNRIKRWAAILHRQQQSLLQHEQQLKVEEKELKKIQREKQWKKSEAAKQQSTEAACAGQKSALQAFISSTDSHANCLKSQLGACTATERMAALSMKCDEPSDGWQKKCMADKAEEMTDCAPLGVDWKAMRRGEKGKAADNAALERLGEWCTFHRALGKIHKSDSSSAFSLILSKDAAVSKEAVQKLSDFGANFKQQAWDLLQVDPIGNPAPLHSVLVKNDSAERLQKAMSQMKAVPLDKMPKAVNDAGTAKAVSWSAGVTGILSGENSDCSLQSPALLKSKQEGKLTAALN